MAILRLFFFLCLTLYAAYKASTTSNLRKVQFYFIVINRIWRIQRQRQQKYRHKRVRVFYNVDLDLIDCKRFHLELHQVVFFQGHLELRLLLKLCFGLLIVQIQLFREFSCRPHFICLEYYSFCKVHEIFQSKFQTCII